MTKNAGLWPGWEVTRQIGQGGFGKVYEIRREIFGDEERAALKVITIPRGEDEVDYLRGSGLDEHSISQTMRRQVESIAEEYKIMVKMRECVNVVHCDDVRFLPHKDGIGWDILIKMELLTPLLKVLDLVQTQEQILQLGKDLCHALMACRKHNIIHRDIKPQNVFRSDEGNFKLGDFGIARTMEQTGRATAGIGTYSFMAPEVMKNEPYGKTADIYSLGLLLYWLLNERRAPFMPLPPVVPRPGEEEQSRNRRLSGEQLPAPKNGTDALKAVVLKACAYRPADRWQTGEEFLHALEALTDGESEKPVRQPKRTEQAPEIRQEWDTPWRPTGAPYGEQTTARGEDDMEETACGVLQLPKSDLQPQRPRERTGTQPRRPKPKRKSRRMLPTVVLLAVALLLIAGLCAIGICAANCTSGGSDLHWEIDGHTGQLTIYDQSAMEEDVPWSGYAEDIETVVIKDGVTSICDYAFAGCINLTTMEVPNSVTAIGDYAFSGCTNLTDVYYFGTLEQWDEISLGDFNEDPTEARLHPMVGSDQLWSFDYATGQLIILDQSAMDMNEETMPWSECAEDIRTVVIKDGVTSICNYAFFWYPCLTAVEIPDSVTSIGEGAFTGTGLISVVISDGVTYIGNIAFNSCDALTSVEIPDSVTYIGEAAFTGCTNLTGVYYSGTSEQWDEIFIGDFNEELTAANIHATDGVIVAETQDDETEENTDISDSADYTYSGDCGENVRWGLNEETGELVITGTGAMNGYRLTVVGVEEYLCTPWYDYPVQTVRIHDGVTAIGENAFRDCTGLTTVEIPDSVTYIGDSAFSGCTGLTSLEIPDSVTYIGEYVFDGCTALTSLEFPDSVTSIGSTAFRNCSNLTWVGIPNAVTTIEGFAFQNCTSLTTLELPGGVTYIGEAAFAGCTGLTSAPIPDSVTYIGAYAFRDCTGLTSVEFPDGVTSIGGTAFGYCSNLTWVELPDGITTIDVCVFLDCTGLTSVTIPDSVTSIAGSAFIGCANLTDVYYTGTSEQWNNIEIKEDTGALTGVNLHFLGEN